MDLAGGLETAPKAFGDGGGFYLWTSLMQADVVRSTVDCCGGSVTVLVGWR